MLCGFHVGIKGNEEADKIVKQAVDDEMVEIELPHSIREIKSVIKEKVATILGQ